ncbi:protein FAM240B isoform X1 [Nothobranchius furzeri]
MSGAPQISQVSPAVRVISVQKIKEKSCPTTSETLKQFQMNLALIHDRLHIKTFWEKRINADNQHAESEEKRMNQSALHKLREEWLVRLENRTKHLKNLNDNLIRKVKMEKSADQT